MIVENGLGEQISEQFTDQIVDWPTLKGDIQKRQWCKAILMLDVNFVKCGEKGRLLS